MRFGAVFFLMCVPKLLREFSDKNFLRRFFAHLVASTPLGGALLLVGGTPKPTLSPAVAALRKCPAQIISPKGIYKIALSDLSRAKLSPLGVHPFRVFQQTREKHTTPFPLGPPTHLTIFL